VEKITITLPDGSTEVHQAGETVRETLSSCCGEALASAVAARVNGQMVDLSRPVLEDASVGLVDISSPEGLGVLRHSISHIMAQAVQDIFKGVKVTIGP